METNLWSLFATFLSFCLYLGATNGLKNGTPVLLWGASSTTLPTKPALSTMDQNDFGDLIKPLLTRHAVLAFVEPNLTTRDFLCYSKLTGRSCHAYLKHVAPKSYYPSVENPIGALRSKAHRLTTITADEAGSPDHAIPCEVGALTLVNLSRNTSAGNNSLNSLTGHDTLISQICQERDCPILFLYTGMKGPVNAAVGRSLRRVPRETQTPATGLQLHALFVFYSKKLFLKDSTGQQEIKIDPIKVQQVKSQLEVTLGDVVLKVAVTADYYVLQEIHLKNIIYKPQDVLTPKTLSFFCGKLVVTNGPNTITWHHVQFQGGSGTEQKAKIFQFYDAWHCVNYFSPAILSGILVMGMIIGISLVGVSCIMDVGSNDKMEDPDKEPFRINAEP